MAQHHTISGLVGKLVTESEVNCNADKYYEMFKQHEDVPKAIPHIFSAVKVVDGHGTTSGCVKHWDYIHEGKREFVHEKTTYDDETRTICHSAFRGDVMKAYKKFDPILVVKPKANGHGSIVSWTINYEKINEDSPVPISYLGFFQSSIDDLNSHICASEINLD
ncbi:major latex protein 15-like [Papaver somniferum]|uniref:major latex protein 15-like n=1 Tax=Papaver somniferum TaxID=3469 RepID=UPI000E7042B1|nr:major latex protein 15-like [Papaver somniferum]